MDRISIGNIKPGGLEVRVSGRQRSWIIWLRPREAQQLASHLLYTAMQANIAEARTRRGARRQRGPSPAASSPRSLTRLPRVKLR